MTPFIFANNIKTALASAVSSTATTITLASSTDLPSSIPTGYYLPITLNDAATGQLYEIVYATAVSGANLTVVRAQEGTSAGTWAIGDYVFCGPTAGQMTSPTAEIISVLTAAGLAPDRTNTGQLLAAEQKLFAAINGSASEAFNVSGPSNPATYPSLALSADNFPSSLSANGWKKYPDPNSPSGYFIEQWGTGAITSTGTGVTGATFTLPIAYPTAPLFCAAGYGGNTPDGTLGAITGSLYSLTQAEVAIYTSAAATNVAIQFWSKGY